MTKSRPGVQSIYMGRGGFPPHPCSHPVPFPRECEKDQEPEGMEIGKTKEQPMETTRGRKR